MRTNAMLIICLTGLVMLTGCGDNHTVTSESDQVAIPVNIIQAQHQAIAVIVDAPGSVQPRNRIPLASQINGFVHEMRVRAGDRVTSGQVLATLDARDAENQKVAAQSAVDEAQAALSEARQTHRAATEMQSASKSSLNLANQTYTRYRKLFESRSVSPQEMDEVQSRRDATQAELASRESMVAAAEGRIKQVEAKISQAKAQLGRADVLMSYTRIQAPATGIIVERSVDTGAAIFPGSPLLTIETTGKPQVLASLPTEHIGSIQIGMKIKLRQSEAAPFIEGRIAEIVPQSNQATHSIRFKVDLPPDFKAVHGQYMKLEIPIGKRDALLVARSAVRKAGQLNGLFVVEDGAIARFRLIKSTPFDAEQLEILSGIEPGEKIIIQPIEQIADGMPVEIQP